MNLVNKKSLVNKLLGLLFMISVLVACGSVKEVKKVEEIVDVVHTAENSIDWTGVYEAVLPCASCPGIKTTLTLNSDKTYNLVQNYLKKKVVNNSKGTFSFDTKDSSLIHLDVDGETLIFFVGEGFIEWRAVNTGEKLPDSENYILKKKTK